MLRWRLISAAVILTVLLALVWLDFRLVVFKTPGAWLLPVLLVVSVLATEELLSLLRAKGLRPIGWIVYAGNIAIPLTASWPVVVFHFGFKPTIGTQTVPIVMALFVVLVLVGEMARYRQPGAAVVNAALSVFALAYIGLLISFWGMLRLHGNNERGMAALFSMLLIVKVADVGAFTFGKMLGRQKMTPVLSPGKTWEGSVGGIVTACVASWVFFRFGVPLKAPLASVLAYGVLLAVAGVIGDLVESMIKRDVGRKDSSTWLRGLGGVLDIIDAPLVAGPVAWVCWTSGMMGP